MSEPHGSLDPRIDATLRALLRPDRVERWLTLLGTPRRIPDAVELLRSEQDWDPRWFLPVPVQRDRQATVQAIADRLRGLGANDSCLVLSSGWRPGAPQVPLVDALTRVVRRNPALLVFDDPTVAYWEGESPLRQILARS